MSARFRCSWMAGLLVAAASLAGAQEPAYRVKDIPVGPGHGSDPSEFVALNGLVYFTANDWAHGVELWRTDGTTAGTQLVCDLLPGPRESYPTALVPFGNLLFFKAAGELWRTDGTAAGTSRVHPDLTSPTNAVVFGGAVYFGATHQPTSTYGLWKTEGTAAGTVRVSAAVGVSELAAAGATLFIAGYTHAEGVELWKSDGTEGGTVFLGDLEPGSASSQPHFLGALGGRVMFTARTQQSGYELWTSDGTTAGTGMVVDLYTGPTGSNPQEARVHAGALYFAADDGLAGLELFRSDGTDAGTVRVADIRTGTESSRPHELTVVAGQLYFAADDGLNGTEVWRTDGTAVGTVLVSSGIIGGPYDLTEHQGNLYYGADDGVHGSELWTISGGMPQLLDLEPGPAGSLAHGVASAGGSLYFSATPAGAPLGHLGEPWKSDGTLAGSAPLKAIAPGAMTGAQFGAHLGSVVVMWLRSMTEGGSGLWRSDGTAAGTYPLFDLVRGPSGSVDSPLAVLGGTAYFFAGDATSLGLWRTDGTSPGTTLVTRVAFTQPGPLTVSGGQIFFSALTPPFERELYKTDGTAAGTVRVKDIYPGNNSSDPNGLVDVGGTLYFFATDAFPINRDVWKSDGTEAGTVRVTDLPDGVVAGYELTALNGRLVFTAHDLFHGQELWATDGTAAGAVLLRDIYPGKDSSGAASLTAANGFVFFVARDPEHGQELWRTDGTSAGTVLVRDIRAGGPNGSPRLLRRVRDVLFFSADDGVTGAEPWRSDGTESGTRPLGDLWSGPDTSTDYSQFAVEWGGWIFFTAGTPTTGQELWRTDGTSAPVMIQDIGPGATSVGIGSSYGIDSGPFVAAGLLFFHASGAGGPALWALRPELHMGDGATDEGASALVAVSLIPRLDRPVTVAYATSDGTAQAGTDYAPATGVVTFPPGSESRTVAATALDDAFDEDPESFFVDLASPVAAYATDARGTVSIGDTDPTPQLAAADVVVTEGGPGDTTAQVTVTAAGLSSFPMTVAFATADGTATSAADYGAVAGTVTFPPGVASATVSVPITGDLLDEPDERFFVTLSAPTRAVVADASSQCTITDDDGGTLQVSELVHGALRIADLAAGPGPVADADLYLLLREPWSSYEVVVDGASGDLGSAGPVVERVAADLVTVLQSSMAAGVGAARSLRVENDTALPVLDYVRVRSNGCTTDCGPDDTYRVRVRETTGRIPRFNDSGGQRTILILQNRTAAPVVAHATYWSAAGQVLGRTEVTVPARGVSVVPSAGSSLGSSGSITVSTDAPYGALVGKAVALDPAGFAFDTPLSERPR